MLDDLKYGVSCSVGDGLSIQFWTDHWPTEDKSLLSFLICEVPKEVVYECVDFFAGDND